ncbi:DUF4870 family protein [Indioceanicola profundi]|uniref:DUF4870 family protein n=1 Tax=Indioceanicola profundi TaxID=2220096 RepID=UPI000E6A9E5F|nr:hypothetical protein [Indioceanicola profundi]
MSYDPYVSRRQEQLRNAALIAWISYAVGLATSWVTGPIGFIIALVKRGDSVGTIWESHFDALFRSGVLCFLGYTIGWLLVFTVIGAIIGFPLLLVTWIYNVYVVVRGGLRLFDGRPY